MSSKLVRRLKSPRPGADDGAGSHDQTNTGILDAVRALMAAPESVKRRRIGFVQKDWTHGSRLIRNRPAGAGGGDFLKIC